MLGKSRVHQKNKNKNNVNEVDTMRLTRFLITINIPGSAGPIRFVVNEEDLVSGVIDTALKSYARLKRLPVLGSDTNNFFLYSATVGLDALNPLKPIGSYGARNFVLCKKQAYPAKTEEQPKMAPRALPKQKTVPQKRCHGLKLWFNKSITKTLLTIS